MAHTKSTKNEDQPSILLPTFFCNDKPSIQSWFGKILGKTFPAVTIEFTSPGFHINDFKITVQGDQLMINAEKEKNENNTYFERKESFCSSFSHSFTLHENADTGYIDLDYNNGLFKLTIPKKVETKLVSYRSF